MATRQLLTYGIAALFMFIGTERTVAEYHIPGNTTIGSWDSGNRTYTLTQDVYDSAIVIDEDNLTLDGAECTVDLYSTGIMYGINLNQRTTVVIKNVTVKNCTRWNGSAIYIRDGSNVAIMNSSFENCFRALYFTNTSNSSIVGNTFNWWCYRVIELSTGSNCNVMRNNMANCVNQGVIIDKSDNNQIYNNSFTFEYTPEFPAYVREGIGNVFNLDWPIGGNYWGNHTAPDSDNDGFVDTPMAFDGGQDNLPWTVQDGWLTAEVRIVQLVNKVVSLNLQQGIANSLDAKLDAVKKALADVNQNNDGAAVNALSAFISAVEAQRGSKISEADADYLTESARQIIDLLNNG